MRKVKNTPQQHKFLLMQDVKIKSISLCALILKKFLHRHQTPARAIWALLVSKWLWKILHFRFIYIIKINETCFVVSTFRWLTGVKFMWANSILHVLYSGNFLFTNLCLNICSKFPFFLYEVEIQFQADGASVQVISKAINTDCFNGKL